MYPIYIDEGARTYINILNKFDFGLQPNLVVINIINIYALPYDMFDHGSISFFCRSNQFFFQALK